jgi:hypothetical protein
VSLESFLNTMLSNLELTWLIQNETLLITTPEHAESQLHTRVYPVADLVFPQGSKHYDEADYDTLIQMITSTIAPGAWDQVVGPGAIEPEPNSFALVISQTEEVHHPIEDLLAALRRVRSFQHIPQVVITATDHARPQPLNIKQPVHLRLAPRRYAYSAEQGWLIPRLHD